MLSKVANPITNIPGIHYFKDIPFNRLKFYELIFGEEQQQTYLVQNMSSNVLHYVNNYDAVVKKIGIYFA
jgi:hypothetical protein